MFVLAAYLHFQQTLKVMKEFGKNNLFLTGMTKMSSNNRISSSKFLVIYTGDLNLEGRFIFYRPLLLHKVTHLSLNPGGKWEGEVYSVDGQRK